MKVKLLKKIRKRYSIIHYPNGVYLGDRFWEGPITCLRDNTNEWRLQTSFSPKERAYSILYNHMLYWIEKDYGPFKSRNRKITSEQLWYKK
jgi:hypothetical protein